MRVSSIQPTGPSFFGVSLLLALASALSAQQISLSGQVVDQKGAPMDGVLVRMLGADMTTLTGSDGRWTFEEGTPKALFPKRLQSASSITWAGPGEAVNVEVKSLTCVSVLMFNAKGEQLRHLHQNCEKGRSSMQIPEVPAEAVLVSIASQACDRVVYRLPAGANPRKAVLTFSTCTGASEPAKTGVLDMISVEHPRFLPVRVPLTSLTKSEAALAKSTLVPLKGRELHVDPVKGNDSGNGAAASPFKSLAAVRAKLTGGETVILHDGDYGAFDLGDETGFTWWVTFVAASGAKPTLERISSNARNSGMADGEYDLWMRFEGLTITDGVSLRGARWIEFNNCKISRIGELNGSDENMNKVGINFRQVRGLRVEGCDIVHCGIGLNGLGNHVIYRRNQIHDISMDNIHFFGGHDFLCEYNDIHDCEDGATDAEQRGPKPWNAHCDSIQLYPIFDNDEPMNWIADATLRGNRIYRPEAMAWMLQNKNDGQLKRWLIENNITTAVPGYMFHFKDACDGLVFRFNSFLLPVSGYQFTGMFGTKFDTKNANNYVALPSGGESADVEIYGNIMGAEVDFDGPKLTRCDNNIYFSPDGGTKRTGTLGTGELVVRKQPFLDTAKIDGKLAPDCPAVKAGMTLPKPPTDRMQVALPAYDAYGKPRNQAKITLGAVEAN